MTDKLIEIKITKATLFLYEHEFMKHLPTEMVALGLRRGKWIMRERKQAAREEEKQTALDSLSRSHVKNPYN